MTDPVLAPPPHDNPKDSVVLLTTLLKQQGHWKHQISGQWGARLSDAVRYFQQTHLGPDGSPLDVDGWVGEDTWWALRNAHGEAQRSGLVASIPDGIAGARRRVLEVALAEHAKDVKEIPNGSNRGPDVDKYYPAWRLKQFGSGKGDAWCAFFVNWDVTQVMERPWGGYIGSCYSLWKACQEKGLRVHSDPALVRPGDLGLLMHGDPSAGRTSGHALLVLRVNGDGSEINTVEGNCGNRVKVGRRRTDSLYCFVNFYGDAVPNDGFVRGLAAVADVSLAGTR